MISKASWLRMLVKLLKFSSTSLLGTGVDTLVLWLCSDYVFSDSYVGVNIISPAISFEAAALNNFTLAYFFIWNDRLSIQNVRSFVRHFLGYNLSCMGVFLLKMGFLLLIQYLFRWDVILCNLLAVCLSGFFNFLMNERVIFRRIKNTKETE